MVNKQCSPPAMTGASDDFKKLLYIYILGWNVDFGHLEAVNLISANKYSEKQIGYLAMTLFLHEKHELLHLVVNSIRKDLLDHNELFNCLALHAIANVGGREMGEALSAEVHRLLISPYVPIVWFPVAMSLTGSIGPRRRS